MKKKVSILTISILLTIILFCISTYLQRKMIDYEPTTKCYIANVDVEEREKITKDKIKLVEIPIPLVLNRKIIQKEEELDEMYAKSKVYAGQILMKDQFDTKENLSVYIGEAGKEKISIKIKSAENGVSYRLRENSLVNIYATLRTEYSNNIFTECVRNDIGDENDGYCSIKILENIPVIGVFDSNGKEVKYQEEDTVPDTIMISVTSEQARDINLIREVATFHITELEVPKLEGDIN